MTNHFPGHFENGAFVYDTICKQCGRCCKYAWRVKGNDIHDDFYIAKGGRYCPDDNVIYCPEPCQHLTADNKCGIHDHKPEVCIAHGEDPDMFYPVGCAYREYIVEHNIDCKTLRAIKNGGWGVVREES